MEKGHFLIPSTYVIDTICISKLPQYLNRIYLHQKYIVENLSAKKIGLSIGCSTTTIKLRLKEFGLKKGGPGKAMHKQKLAYGKKMVAQLLEDHQAETRVIESIKRMYSDEKVSPTGIARILDSMKLPTKKQGKKWAHSVVIDILEREGLYKQSRMSPRKKGTYGKDN